MPSPRKRIRGEARPPNSPAKPEERAAMASVEVRPLHKGASIHVWLVRDAAGIELVRDLSPTEAEANARADAYKLSRR